MSQYKQWMRCLNMSDELSRNSNWTHERGTKHKIAINHQQQLICNVSIWAMNAVSQYEQWIEPKQLLNTRAGDSAQNSNWSQQQSIWEVSVWAVNWTQIAIAYKQQLTCPMSHWERWLNKWSATVRYEQWIEPKPAIDQQWLNMSGKLSTQQLICNGSAWVVKQQVMWEGNKFLWSTWMVKVAWWLTTVLQLVMTWCLSMTLSPWTVSNG